MREKSSKLSSLASAAATASFVGEDVSVDATAGRSLGNGRGTVGRVHSSTVNGRASDLSCIEKYNTIKVGK